MLVELRDENEKWSIINNAWNLKYETDPEKKKIGISKDLTKEEREAEKKNVETENKETSGAEVYQLPPQWEPVLPDPLQIADTESISLEDSDDIQSQFTKALSQSIHTERFKKRKSESNQPQLPSPKRFCLMKRVVADTSSLLSEEEYEEHVKELQSEWNSRKHDVRYISTLLNETKPRRRIWLSTLPSGKLSPILEKFPCLGDGNYIIQEMEALLSDTMSTWKERLKDMVKTLSHEVPSSGDVNSDQHVVNVMKFIEKSIGYKKDKGVKSKTLITVVESKNTERPNDRTPVTGVEDSGSEGSAGTLDILDSQDHHISIAESESGEETISQESSTSKDRRTRARTVQKRRTHRQTDINTSRSKTRSQIDRPTV
ncbi:hypothetical protein Pmani_021772 [Petrolisthes manimaculis]|uniref:Uncharacterized protein n=1 Tax=Petrolisthes manimaculis TaxID=1843537 RepID=A0AAE1U1T9_9EUCA|nr:hypothetical protein Pmani_021772 [Petrolisthes manimaculis]